MYEFYYTSPPAGSAPKDAEFTSFYDFRFGTINCVAYHDLCMEHQVGSWPTTIVFENGKPITIFKGIKTIPILSTGVEDVLEKARPGTRPEHLVLPEPGDPSSPDQKAESASETAPEANNASTPEQKVDTKADVAATSAAAQATGWTPPPFTPPTQKTLKPKSTLNPNGVSVALSPESFDKLVRKSQDIWFVKFYAPWCHHCQKMAPSWEQMAKQMQGRLNIGEVNCEANSKLCKDVGTKGFPTMMLFKGNQRVEYQGLRGVGDFLNFAESAVGVSSGIQDVDFDSFKALEEKEEVIFLYFYDHATTSYP